MSSESARPKRRPRYLGKHPRKFHEKYKELNPDKYPDEIQKVKDAGKTPAGSHRPICLTEIIEILKPRRGQTVVDATLGYGGHSLEILKKITPGGRLFGFDLDSEELPKTEARLLAAGFGSNTFTACHGNFATIPQVLSSLGAGKANLILADLGVSSMQLDNPERGFSFKTEGPLNLRLNPKGGDTAAHLLKSVNEKMLAKIFEDNADEEFAELISHHIILQQRRKPIETTEALTETIRKALKTLPLRRQIEIGDLPIRRVFQALRIAVNFEYKSLEQFLENLPEVLAPGGRVAVLTFHSGEDRRVKKAFQAGLRSGFYHEVARDVIRPSASEIHSNPRASSAKLRWARRSTLGASR
jgi:16S rRNA (cytosine1402-N4)-methyltransferase